MCLILLALEAHVHYKVIIAGNRDEYYDRPTAPAGFWEDYPNLLAGKDLRAGGTWMGVTRKGKIAAVTNYRDPASLKDSAPSRGNLVLDYLLGPMDPEAYLDRIIGTSGDYNGFSLLFGERERLLWYSNRAPAPRRLTPGIYGISNHLLDTPWPKVKRGKEALTRLLLEEKDLDTESVFAILGDAQVAEDGSLPHTGVGLERERMLSPLFVRSPIYGTRSSTLLFIDFRDRLTFVERTFDPLRDRSDTVTHTFRIES